VANRLVWAGKYAVFDELASGGMASVFLACRLGPGESPRVVAVKKMFEQFAKKPEFVTMFLDEAHIAARIRHPNVVTTYEFLRVPDSLAIVMELVLGVSFQDLTEISEERARLTPPEITSAVLRDALLGLHAAHEAKDDHGNPFGLVHRDVSPHNILVGKDGVARVIDFGIAKAAGRLQVTDVGVMKGKFAYMAPEQIRVADVDRRVDVYASGLVLWEALTGRGLFHGEAAVDLLSKRADGTVVIPPPSSANPALSRRVDAVVMRALEPDRVKRFATAREMADALTAVIAPATARDVAAWVESLAKSKLRELETKRNEVETAYAAGELAGLTGAPPSSAALVANAPAAPDLAIPDLLPPPRSSARSLPSDAAPPSKRKPVAPPAPVGGLDTFGDAEIPDVRLDLAVSEPPRSRASPVSVRVPGGPVSSRTSRSVEAPRRARGGHGKLLLFFLIAAIGTAAWTFGPAFLRSAVMNAAARRGVVVAVDRIEPRSGGLALTGVTVSLAGVNDLTLKAAEVDLGLDWQGSVQKIFAPGFEITFKGNVADLATHFDAWRKQPHLPLALDAKAGHILWSDPIVPGVQVEGIGASLSVGALGEGALHLEIPSVTLGMPQGNVGPWRAIVDSTIDETKVTVALDRSKLDGPPNIAFVARPALGSVLTATIPRTKVLRVGLPVELVHAGPDPELELALEGEVQPSDTRLSAHATLSLFGVPTPTGAGTTTPVDLTFEVAIAGDTSRPLNIDPGTITVGKNKMRMTGDVAFEHDGLRIEVYRPSPPKGVPAAPPYVLDTREWTVPRDATASSTSSAPPAPVPTGSGRRR